MDGTQSGRHTWQPTTHGHVVTSGTDGSQPDRHRFLPPSLLPPGRQQPRVLTHQQLQPSRLQHYQQQAAEQQRRLRDQEQQQWWNEQQRRLQLHLTPQQWAGLSPAAQEQQQQLLLQQQQRLQFEQQPALPSPPLQQQQQLVASRAAAMPAGAAAATSPTAAAADAAQGGAHPVDSMGVLQSMLAQLAAGNPLPTQQPIGNPQQVERLMGALHMLHAQYHAGH